MEKILKYLFKGHMINATMNVSFKSITDALDINIYGRWKLCSHLFKNVIQQLVVMFRQLEYDTFLWQKSKLLTMEICWQNLLKNLLTESADKNQICWQEKSADRICWQKLNLLTTKKPCRLDTSKPHLKTSHHASQAMAGAHIPSVKFNACICAWAEPSCGLNSLQE